MFTKSTPIVNNKCISEPIYGRALLRSYTSHPAEGRQRPGDGLRQRQLRGWVQAEERLHLHARPFTAHVSRHVAVGLGATCRGYRDDDTDDREASDQMWTILA